MLRRSAGRRLHAAVLLNGTAKSGPTAEEETTRLRCGPGTSTGTGTGTVYGPQLPNKKSPVDGWKNQDDNKEKEIDPEDLTIEVLVPPNELEGYKILWRLATESKGKQIIDAAAKLLVQMHHNVHTTFEHRLAEFDEMFIS